MVIVSLDSRKKNGLILSTRGPDLASVTGEPLPIVAFPFEPLPQRSDLPHGGDGEFFEGHEFLRIETFSRDVSLHMEPTGQASIDPWALSTETDS